MININKNLIHYGFGILAISIFSFLILPLGASAEGGSNMTFGSSGNNYARYNNSSFNQNTYQAPIYTAPTPAPTPIVYSSSTNPNGVNTVQTTTYGSTAKKTTTVAKAKTTTTKSSAIAYYIAVPAGATTVKTIPAGATVAKADTSISTSSDENTYSGLTANAFFGSNSFLPSGLIQWIILAIFILLLVILTRTIFGSKTNYHSTPLKHE